MSAPVRKNSEKQTAPRYADDLYSWSKHQASLLRAGRVAEIDALNIAEELDDVGNEQYGKLESALSVLLTHMLKWDHQPAMRSRSWVNSIREQRRRVERLLRKNPGLKSALDEAIIEGYEDARDSASTETNLDVSKFPESCPYDFSEITTRHFSWPVDA
jgi:predicted  nucleic acid-binding Zn-ribbon protein